MSEYLVSFVVLSTNESMSIICDGDNLMSAESLAVKKSGVRLSDIEFIDIEEI